MSIAPIWNWQQNDWPEFRYERAKMEALEAEFLYQSGVFMGSIRHVGEDSMLILSILGNDVTPRSTSIWELFETVPSLRDLLQGLV